MRLLVALLFAAICFGQPPKYEMDDYVVGLLKKGPKWTTESTPEIAEVMKGHAAHIGKMADTGKLVVAGPFRGTGDVRGMLIFKGMTIDEVRELAAQDPAVKAGRLALEVHGWYAGKGLAVAPPK